jgi:hypothetical protein
MMDLDDDLGSRTWITRRRDQIMPIEKSKLSSGPIAACGHTARADLAACGNRWRFDDVKKLHR